MAVTSQRFDSDLAGTRPVFRRDLTTYACYFLLALLTLFMAMLGPLTPALMSDLGLGFKQASLHSVAQASGIAVTGAVGERFVRRLGRNGCVHLSLLLLCSGNLLVCLATHPAMSMTGAFVVGCGAALTLTASNAALAERHGVNTGIAYGEANIIAYLGIVTAPAVVSLLTVYGNWRWTFVVAISVTLLFALVFRTASYGAAPNAMRREEASKLGFAYWCFWGFLAASIAAETTLLFWTAAYFDKQLGWAREAALMASLAFPAGSLVARSMGVFLVRRIPVQQLVLPTIAVGAAGFLLFRFGGSGPVALVGLAVAGFGMGNLYPFGITLAMGAAGGNRDTATARVSLASAAAMISAPLIVGAIADHADLATAFAVVPIYLTLAAIVTVIGLRRQAPASVSAGG